MHPSPRVILVMSFSCLSTDFIFYSNAHLESIIKPFRFLFYFCVIQCNCCCCRNFIIFRTGIYFVLAVPMSHSNSILSSQRKKKQKKQKKHQRTQNHNSYCAYRLHIMIHNFRVICFKNKVLKYFPHMPYQ